MITRIIVWIEIEHIIHLLLFVYPSIIILIEFEERTVDYGIYFLPRSSKEMGDF